MSYEIFSYDAASINGLLEENIDNLLKIRALSELLGDKKLPNYLIEYIKHFCPAGDKSIAIHSPRSISGYSDADQKSITRVKGFIGNPQLELSKFPDAIHHLFIFYNDEGNAKVYYKYHGNVRFLKSTRQK